MLSFLHHSLFASVAAASSAVRAGKTAGIVCLLHHHRVPSATLPHVQLSSHSSPLRHASSIAAVTHPRRAVAPSRVREPAPPTLPRQSPLAASHSIWSLLQASRESNAGALFFNLNQVAVPTLPCTKVAHCSQFNHGKAVFFSD
ncbi:uncharacterized protein DS421_17g584410 [Arachis hypogaea]|nr:uncharacterized protein DS421_17g584410 [Arachis hypogaea]